MIIKVFASIPSVFTLLTLIPWTSQSDNGQSHCACKGLGIGSWLDWQKSAQNDQTFPGGEICFIPLLGEDFQFDEHIFKAGWKHQLSN